MKINYVKQNSERSREFQLKTIIFTLNGEKFVKKQAMTPEAIPHLRRMKENYKKLSDSIINPAIKLAKIVDEDENSLTFEFIEGVSLEHKHNQAKKEGKVQEVIDTYMALLTQGFKTLPFDSSTMVTKAFKETLGDFDYSQCDGELCFDGISNIDLIFSNILYKDDTIYLIDYEWVYDFNIPVNFSAFRALHTFNELHWKMEKHFVFKRVVGEYGFLNIQKKYMHSRITVAEDLKKNNKHIQNLDLVINDKDSIIQDKDVHIKSQELSLKEFKKLSNSLQSIIKDKDNHITTQEGIIQNYLKLIDTKEKIIKDKDVHIETQEKTLKERIEQVHQQTLYIEEHKQHIEEQNRHIQQLHGDIEHWHNVAKDMTLKNRVKKVLKKVFPIVILRKLKSLKQNILGLSTTQSISIKEDSTPIIIKDNPYCYREPSLTTDIKDEITNFEYQPLISVIMPVYNVDPKWLQLAIDSIESQWYSNWELCIADDKSTNKKTIKFLKKLKNPKIKITFMKENLNISGASNEALALTSGEYIALMDNDDEITADALYEMVKAINETGADFLYSDEDKIEMDNSFSDPHFKPNFAPDMFLSQNYMSHLGLIKKDFITKVGGFTLGLEGSQDFDLYLKVLEHTDKVHHISKVLYHWRKIPGSTAAEYGEKSYAQEAGRKALENAMQRRNIAATVKNGLTPGTYKVDYIIKDNPLISIIIPFKDMPELLRMSIGSVLEKSSYQNYEIIGISNNSTEDATFEEMRYLENLDSRVSFYEYNVPFNYSDINNHAVNAYAKGEHIIFLNNDIEIISDAWIEEMLMYSQQPQNGAIGAKLYFPNDTIQHGGLVITPKTIHSVILMYQGLPREDYGYGSRLRCVNNYSAVTAACLMMKRSLFDKIDGFDAENLSIAYNDVDLCLRAQESGYHNIWTPYCEAYHHESISRGYEISRESVERREHEKYNLKTKHPKIFTEGDPYYNKNLSRFSVTAEIAETVRPNYTDVEGIPFYEKLILTENIHQKQHNTVTLFSHFDTNNEIQDYVIHYLKALSQFSDIVFVSTAEGLEKENLEQIKLYCKDIIIKKNIGYDFGAWKSGLNYINTDLAAYEKLILCNDSVYGPFVSLEEISKKMDHYDLWAMTDNHEIEYHLQSYFMVYSKKAFQDTIFTQFWENIKIFPNKQALIENNEIGFSQQFINSDLTCGVYFSAKEKYFVNVLQYYWKELITEHHFPFIKKEVLKTNPLGLDISQWEEVISSATNYNTTLITKS